MIPFGLRRWARAVAVGCAFSSVDARARPRVWPMPYSPSIGVVAITSSSRANLPACGVSRSGRRERPPRRPSRSRDIQPSQPSIRSGPPLRPDIPDNPAHSYSASLRPSGLLTCFPRAMAAPPRYVVVIDEPRRCRRLCDAHRRDELRVAAMKARPRSQSRLCRAVVVARMCGAD